MGVGKENYCGGAISSLMSKAKSALALALITNSKHEVRTQFMCISDETQPDQMDGQFCPKIKLKIPDPGGNYPLLPFSLRTVQKGHEKAFQFA